MKLPQILFTQGFGTRRACEGLVAGGYVAIAGVLHDDPSEDLDPTGLVLNVEGQDWPYHAKALIALNKPAGYECSKKPKHHASVYGLLLFTDDGQLLHRWTSPKHHVPKVYDASCKHPVTPDQIARLLAGVVLQDDPEPVRAIAAEPWDGAAAGLHGIRLTLAEGKYHQVKRMMAAVGNRVEALHRSRFGRLELPADLAPGAWCWLAGPQVIAG